MPGQRERMFLELSRHDHADLPQFDRLAHDLLGSLPQGGLFLVGEWPDLTILLPAYDEGRGLRPRGTIAASDYPRGRLKMIAVTTVARRHLRPPGPRPGALPGLVEIRSGFAGNGGARGLYEVFRRADMPFVVTVDRIPRRHRRHPRLLTPLLLDPGWATPHHITPNGKPNLSRACSTSFRHGLRLHPGHRVHLRQRSFARSAPFRPLVARRSTGVHLRLTDQRPRPPCSYGEDRASRLHAAPGYGTCSSASPWHAPGPEGLGRI